MTITEYLQQFVDAAKDDNGVGFVLSRTSGDSQGWARGEIWTGKDGVLRLNSKGTAFEGSILFSPVYTKDGTAKPYQVDIVLSISSARLTLQPSLLKDFEIEHVQLSYSDGGVLYGVSTVDFLASESKWTGPVVTLSLQTILFV